MVLALVHPALGLKLEDIVGPYKVKRILDFKTGKLIKADKGASILLRKNLKLKGSSGCNTFTGTFKYEEGKPLKIRDIEATEVACEGSTEA